MNTYARNPVEFVRGEGTRLWDVFMLMVVLGSLVYVAGYAYFLDASCFAGETFIEDWNLPFPGRDDALHVLLTGRTPVAA